jgi:predicted nucleotide-binding protein (sugar kinase/HSP70/actin superfamily)
MVNRSIGIILMVIILTAIITGVSFGCGRENQVIDGVNNMITNTPKLPSIDTAVSVKIETATFSLG